MQVYIYNNEKKGFYKNIEKKLFYKVFPFL